jgi:predicted HTH transcriptional regulator
MSTSTKGETMLARQLGDVNEALLQSVCTEKWSESQTLEFKRVLPGTDDKSKQEFPKDICALANTGGGDVVYGIGEVKGQADHLVPTEHVNDFETQGVKSLASEG